VKSPEEGQMPTRLPTANAGLGKIRTFNFSLVVFQENIFIVSLKN
jgi:hypothetical protein